MWKSQFEKADYGGSRATGDRAASFYTFLYILDVYCVFNTNEGVYMIFKQIKFPSELIKKIQEYANQNTDGNFSMAVRQLIKKGFDND